MTTTFVAYFFLIGFVEMSEKPENCRDNETWSKNPCPQISLDLREFVESDWPKANGTKLKLTFTYFSENNVVRLQ